MKSNCFVPILFAAALFPLQANAVLLTDSAEIPINAPVINFAQFTSAGRISFQTGDFPIEIDALQHETVLMRPISGTSTVAIIAGEHTPPLHPDNSYYLGTNGHWGPNRDGFLGIGGGNGSRVAARIEFATGPVAIVGGLFNYPPDLRWTPLLITALDEKLVPIEQYAIDIDAPISTPFEVDTGEFRGIFRKQRDIFAIEFSGSFAVIDDIRFSRVIPEPDAFIHSALAMILAILSLRASGLRRRIE